MNERKGGERGRGAMREIIIDIRGVVARHKP